MKYKYIQRKKNFCKMRFQKYLMNRTNVNKGKTYLTDNGFNIEEPIYICN